MTTIRRRGPARKCGACMPGRYLRRWPSALQQHPRPIASAPAQAVPITLRRDIQSVARLRLAYLRVRSVRRKSWRSPAQDTMDLAKRVALRAADHPP
jgi:hypothetical protein